MNKCECGQEFTKHSGDDGWPCDKSNCTGYRPKAEPPERTMEERAMMSVLLDKTTLEPCPTSGQLMCTITEDDHLHIFSHMVEPKASPSLEDAARAYAEKHYDKPCSEVVASFARQQRREAVAEFVERLRAKTRYIAGLSFDDWITKREIEAIAKEMESE